MEAERLAAKVDTKADTKTEEGEVYVFDSQPTCSTADFRISRAKKNVLETENKK